MKSPHPKKWQLLALTLGIGLLAGCSTAAPAAPVSPTDTAAGPALVEVLDLEGTSVSVPPPDEIDSIVVTSYKGAFDSAVLLGQLDKITGMAQSSNRAWFGHA
ncbi:MAG: hypothetical protein ACK5LN_08940, partial [Propioniciclava sp.]